LWDANPDPTYVARPGTSNHEKGNAIDFVDAGGALAWLRENASKFGFYNYPAEPWHYSTNGR
jgi:LAS superfamily LD-carboxypeptidase LdcB